MGLKELCFILTLVSFSKIYAQNEVTLRHRDSARISQFIVNYVNSLNNYAQNNYPTVERIHIEKEYFLQEGEGNVVLDFPNIPHQQNYLIRDYLSGMKNESIILQYEMAQIDILNCTFREDHFYAVKMNKLIVNKQSNKILSTKELFNLKIGDDGKVKINYIISSVFPEIFATASCFKPTVLPPFYIQIKTGKATFTENEKIGFSGDIMANRPEAITETGIVWSYLPHPTIADSILPALNTIDLLFLSLADLEPEKEVFYNVYAKAENEIFYGESNSLVVPNRVKKQIMDSLVRAVVHVPSPSPKPTIEWVDIPGGTFLMGSPENEIGRQDDEKQIQISISAFKMSKYEITFAQYDLFCEETGRSNPRDNTWGRENRPVINVNWVDADAFAKWLGCRLPTEAEWEYACKAGSETPFNSGDNLTTEQANYDGNRAFNGNTPGLYRQKSSPIGSFVPNAWGLHDMHGNVWEWCSDWYGDYPNAPTANPQGPATGKVKVYRGGSWGSDAEVCRSAYRNHLNPNNASDFIGIRLVLVE
jgi:formylglycine-generating enzyme required for sulfatase activity